MRARPVTPRPAAGGGSSRGPPSPPPASASTRPLELFRPPPQPARQKGQASRGRQPPELRRVPGGAPLLRGLTPPARLNRRPRGQLAVSRALRREVGRPAS